MEETNALYVPIEIPKEHQISPNITFSRYSKIWIYENEETLAIKTCERYKSLLVRINMGIGHIPLKELSSYHIKQFLRVLSKDGMNKRTGGKLSAKTILHHYRLISVILQQAVRDCCIPFNPACKERVNYSHL
jgi:hypothetical protein